MIGVVVYGCRVVLCLFLLRVLQSNGTLVDVAVFCNLLESEFLPQALKRLVWLVGPARRNAGRIEQTGRVPLYVQAYRECLDVVLVVSMLLLLSTSPSQANQPLRSKALALVVCRKLLNPDQFAPNDILRVG